MTAFALTLLFIIQIAFGLLLAWAWSNLRKKQAEFDLRLSESLDDQDLAAFNESVSELVAELNQASEDNVQRTEEHLQALEKLLKKADAGEKRLARRVASAEASQEKLDKRIQAAIGKAVKSLPAAKKSAKTKTSRKEMPSVESLDSVAAAVMQVLSGPAQQEQATAEIEASLEMDKAPARPVAQSIPETAPRAAAESGVPRDQVWKMADEGQDSYQIAEATGLLPGEIELILNLKPGRRRS